MSPFSWIRRILGTVFLPVGYPASVSDEYLTYQFWDTLQAMTSYLRGVLATQALLEGLGVGKADATSQAAIVAWVFKDGASMIGSLCFTTVFSSAMDANVKSWRLFADGILDVGLTLDLIAPMYPNHFVHIACVSSVFKAWCGVSAGATKANLTTHFSKANNMADVQVRSDSSD
jgi:hypothetical protein